MMAYCEEGFVDKGNGCVPIEGEEIGEEEGDSDADDEEEIENEEIEEGGSGSGSEAEEGPIFG